MTTHHHKVHEDEREPKQTISKSQANSLRERAKACAKSSAEMAFQFGKVLYQVYYTDVNLGNKTIPVWKAWGFEDWFLYCECELHMHAATAHSYKNVYNVFGVELNGAWSKSDLLPISKMRAISRIADKKNVKKWLKDAKKWSVCQTEEEVEYALTGKRKRMRSFAAKMTDANFREIKGVLKEAAELYDDLDRGELMTELFRQWRKSYSKRGGATVTGIEAARKKKAAKKKAPAKKKVAKGKKRAN